MAWYSQSDERKVCSQEYLSSKAIIQNPDKQELKEFMIITPALQEI